MQAMMGLRNMAYLGTVALLVSSSSVAALTIQFCSDANTAPTNTLQSSIYQSNGLCETQCNPDYAYAVLQGQNCWCSNYAPSAQIDVSNCNTGCPGYPPDQCGNPDQGLFAYIAMTNVKPSGTTSGVVDVTSTPSQSSSSTSSESTATEISTSKVDTVTVTVSDSTSTTLATSTLISSASSTTSTNSPVVSVQTVAGQPTTITVSNAATSSPDVGTGSTNKSTLSGGAIAGIIIGSLAALAAIAAIIVWWFFFGGNRGEDRSEKTGSPNGGNASSVGGATADTRRQSKGSQMSFMRNFIGPGEQEVVPTSPIDYLNPNHAFTDNRMKKDAVLYPNGDRHSAVSLRDNEDYSRPVLRLTNPD